MRLPDERARRISELLHEVAEAQHVVYRITDGDDDSDWASRTRIGCSICRSFRTSSEPVRRGALSCTPSSRSIVSTRQPKRIESSEDWYAVQLVEQFGA